MMAETDHSIDRLPIGEDLLRKYLLGQCSYEEADRIERAAFGNDRISTALAIIEDELTEDYVTDKLNEFERACFELKFLTGQERREKIRLSAMLLKRTEVLTRAPSPFIQAHQMVSAGTASASVAVPGLVVEHVVMGDRKGLKRPRFLDLWIWIRETFARVVEWFTA